MRLSNYSLSIKKLEVKYWDKNPDDPRSSGEAVRDLHPKGLRFLLLPVSLSALNLQKSLWLTLVI